SVTRRSSLSAPAPLTASVPRLSFSNDNPHYSSRWRPPLTGPADTQGYRCQMEGCHDGTIQWTLPHRRARVGGLHVRPGGGGRPSGEHGHQGAACAAAAQLDRLL